MPHTAAAAALLAAAALALSSMAAPALQRGQFEAPSAPELLKTRTLLSLAAFPPVGEERHCSSAQNTTLADADPGTVPAEVVRGSEGLAGGQPGL